VIDHVTPPSPLLSSYVYVSITTFFCQWDSYAKSNAFMCPQLQGESSIEVESYESLESSLPLSYKDCVILILFLVLLIVLLTHLVWMYLKLFLTKATLFPSYLQKICHPAENFFCIQ